MDDLQGAIEAYERALELEPASTFTLDNLIPLYEQKGDAARLVDLYRRRIDLCGEDDDSLKYELLVAAATRYETGLEDRREAIDLLTEALACARDGRRAEAARRAVYARTHVAGAAREPADAGGACPKIQGRAGSSRSESVPSLRAIGGREARSRHTAKS